MYLIPIYWTLLVPKEYMAVKVVGINGYESDTICCDISGHKAESGYLNFE